MSADRPSGSMAGGLGCAEVAELAGVYVLGALEPADASRVAAHLADCPEAHAEVSALGGVVPALALSVEPIEAPAGLRARVLADYAAANPVAAFPVATNLPARDTAAATPVAGRVAAAPVIPVAAAHARAERPWLSWAAVAAAVVVFALLGGLAVTAQQRADREAQRATVLAEAIEVMAAPGSSVALLRGSGSAVGASGFAAFAEGGAGYLVMTGLPDAPAGQAYQAWYLVDGQPFSAGLLSVEADGFAALPGINAMPGADLIALTLEPASGSLLPTSEPIVVGEVRAPL